jgi:hypothetical protein
MLGEPDGRVALAWAVAHAVMALYRCDDPISPACEPSS